MQLFQYIIVAMAMLGEENNGVVFAFGSDENPWVSTNEFGNE